ncbi:MAG: DUF3313 family protein, partial [Gammaproteobacteria bacterium]|nr:DUF3313 family protein [Gammaproteobacteria bacterium]
MYQIKIIFTALFVVLLMAGCASKPTAKPGEFSGYLGNYDKLTEYTDEKGLRVLRYVNPKLKQGSRTKIILDDIVFYPPVDDAALAEADPKGQITKEALMKIRDYANEALQREVGKVMTLTNQPGPDTLRIRIALTGVSTSTQELKAYEYIPVGLVIAGIATAIGERDIDAFVITEGELLESDTGERLFMSVRKSKAVARLKDTEDPLTADHVRQVIDDAAVEARLWLERE